MFAFGNLSSTSSILHILFSSCKHTSRCAEVTWMCPQCKTYSSDIKPTGAATSQPPTQPTQLASSAATVGLTQSTTSQYGPIGTSQYQTGGGVGAISGYGASQQQQQQYGQISSSQGTITSTSMTGGVTGTGMYGGGTTTYGQRGSIQHR